MWKLGPVVPEVYNEYKMYGSNKIDKVLKVLVFDEELFDVVYKDMERVKIKDYDQEILDNLLDGILEREDLELVDKTLKHELWQKHKDEIINSEGPRKKIVYGSFLEDQKILKSY